MAERMGKTFKLVEQDYADPYIVPKKRGKKPASFNLLNELDLDEEEEKEKERETFTVSSDLYDYGSVSFKDINSLASYVPQKGFDCKIYRNGQPWGYWAADEGIIRF